MSKVKSTTIRWLFSASRKGWGYIVLLTLFQIALGVFGVLYALFIKNIVDSAVSGDKNAFFTWGAAFVGILLIQIIISGLSGRFSELSRSVLENAIKSRLFNNILRKDFSAISATHSGEWMNRLTNDTTVVANGISDIIPGLCGMLVRFVSALIMILTIDWRIAAIILPAGGALAVFAILLRKKLKALHKQVQEKDGLLRIFMQENITSLLLIRSFSTEDDVGEEALARMDDHKNARMKKNRLSNITHMGFMLAMNGMYILGVLYGGYGILMGTITYGTLMAVTQLINQLQGPIVNITGILPKFLTVSASAERIKEIEDFKEAWGKEPSLGQDEIREAYENSFMGFGMCGLSYTYFPPAGSGADASKENMPVAVNNVTFDIRKGEFVAFTGPSGCGKSTILKLLMSIYPQDSGERYVELRSSKSVYGVSEPLSGKWHRLFAYVPQGNFLMSGTIRQIVSFGDRDGINDDARIHRALELAGADEFVCNLENNIDTLLGERGTGLSEGQMQRIAIARALFTDRPILLLDESTSALDEKTEEEVLQNLRRMTNKTVLIVTHRSAALRVCDKVIEMVEP